MLAAAIRIDRPVEADIGRFVAGDDRFGLLPRDLGHQWLRRFVARPAVIEIFAFLKLEAARGVGRGAPPTPDFGWEVCSAIASGR